MLMDTAFKYMRAVTNWKDIVRQIAIECYQELCLVKGHCIGTNPRYLNTSNGAYRS